MTARTLHFRATGELRFWQGKFGSHFLGQARWRAAISNRKPSLLSKMRAAPTTRSFKHSYIQRVMETLKK